MPRQLVSQRLVTSPIADDQSGEATTEFCSEGKGTAEQAAAVVDECEFHGAILS